MAEHILGRNDLCPVCGKKLKRCGGHDERFPWGGLWCGLAIIGIGLGVLYLVDSIWWSRSAPPRAAEVQFSSQRVLQYEAAKPPDRWWLTAVPALDTPEAMAELASQLQMQVDRIRRSLERYHTASDLAGEVVAEFPGYWTSYYRDGISHALVTTRDELPAEGALEVCFIPQDQYASGQHASYCYYRKGWGALMLAALEIPDGAFTGVLFHELGHAVHHRQGRPSATAAPGTDLYITEEVEMHGLETAVFDAVSGGRFTAALDAIIARLLAATNVQEVIVSITQDDLRQLDAAIGAVAAGRTVTGILGAHYVYALGSRFIQHRPGVAQGLAQHIGLYRWLTTRTQRP